MGNLLKRLCVGLWLSQSVWAEDTPMPDPMRPADYVDPARPQSIVETPRGPESLVLTATFTINGIRKAVINGQSLREGDSVAGARLIQVSAGEVLMQRDGEMIVLKLMARANDEKAFFRKDMIHEH